LVAAIACLRAVIFGIKLPDNPRCEGTKQQIALIASKTTVQDYKPSAEKSKAISSQVEKKEEEQEEELKLNEIEKTIASVKLLCEGLESKSLVPQEFEKDNDSNCHIDFIYALANARSENYKLDPMDWLTVKIKAGRIIPALATTTAAIAGLQTIELVKILKKCPLVDMKNSFLNLAVPILQ